jgi:ketosteroid isomerase-like protein
MSANLDLVRSICGDWERGDYSSVEWAHPEIEYVVVGGPSPGRWIGLAGMAETFRGNLHGWMDLHIEVDEYRELDDERVLVLTRSIAFGKATGRVVGQLRAKGATLCHVREGKLTRLVFYWDRDRAFSDLGLEQ